MIKWAEFFRNDKHQESMTRLIVFLSFPISSIEVLRINTTAALSIYTASYGLTYVYGKYRDSKAEIQ